MANTKKYLSEILKDTEYGTNNLIISPVGSGKTHYIISDLVPRYTKVLYLCDTSALKEQVVKDMIGLDNVTVMCYQSFGGKIMTSDEYLYSNEYDCIMCDEFHNLFSYDRKFQSREYSHAIKTLISKSEYITKYYFTATPWEYFMARDTDEGNGFINIIRYDLSERDDIISYIEEERYELNSFREIANTIDEISTEITHHGKKVLIFAEKIDTLKKIEDGINNLGIGGIKPICLWSANSNKPMNSEQLYVREHLLINGKIPDLYNILIINKSMETGINIKDKDFVYCFINSNNPTTQIQARGRLRHDIKCIWTIKSSQDSEVKVDVYKTHWINDYVGIKLTSKEKKEICRRFNFLDKKNQQFGWGKISDHIKKMGYTVTEKTGRIDGKVTKYAIVI